MSKELREWYKSKGICVSCGQREAEPKRTQCFECLEKSAERQRIRRAAMTEEQKQARKEYEKKRYQCKKEQGLCTYCKKRKPIEGKTKCLECTLHYNRKKEEYARARGVLPMYLRGIDDTCYLCKSPVEKHGDRLCRKCLDRLTEHNRTIAANRQKIMKG